MVFQIENYNLKNIVSLNPDFIDNIHTNLNIDGENYDFKSDKVLQSAIEFVHYCRYGEIKSEIGPLEKKLKGFTYGKSFSDFKEYERFNIMNSKFKVSIDGKFYDLEITGVGPVALKISLFLTFKAIDTNENPIEQELKKEIIGIYSQLIGDNTSYQKKLEELQKESDEEEERQAKIRDEVRREEEEKKRKWEELEKMLNSNKPKTDKPFKKF